MFTGLIEAVGLVRGVGPTPGGRIVEVQSPLAAGLASGDSVSVNGVCLTATSLAESSFLATISPETMRVTTLGNVQTGERVNLERPLKFDGRLGGHFVLGHVDGVGTLTAIEPAGDCFWLDVDVPAELSSFLIHKGSIAIDGISLTIAALEGSHVRVQIVPFTWEHTALPDKRPGAAVNIETDVIGKHVARLMGHQRSV